MSIPARAGGLGLFVLGLTAGLASAAPDGDVAPPWRWSDPRGTVSGSRRSGAHAITRGVEEAWSVRFEAGPVASEPVTWDGRLYVLAGASEATKTLYAVDLDDGTVLADRTLRGAPDTRPSVWDDLVYVRTASNRIEAFHLAGRRLQPRWSYKGDADVGDPLVFEGELYVPTAGPDRLLKLRGGSLVGVWEAPCDGRIVGRPAIYGKNVYVLLVAPSDEPKRLAIAAYRRANGTLCDSENVAQFSPIRRGAPPEPELTIGPTSVCVASPLPLLSEAGPCWNALVPCQFPDRDPMIQASDAGLVDLRSPPALATQGLIALTVQEQPFWGIWKGRAGAVLASRRESPDLFESSVAPTVLGDVVYFGSWAADIETLEVLWRLPFGQVRYGAVPADGMVVVVDAEGVLRAFRERRGR